MLLGPEPKRGKFPVPSMSLASLYPALPTSGLVSHPLVLLALWPVPATAQYSLVRLLSGPCSCMAWFLHCPVPWGFPLTGPSGLVLVGVGAAIAVASAPTLGLQSFGFDGFPADARQGDLISLVVVLPLGRVHRHHPEPEKKQNAPERLAPKTRAVPAPEANVSHMFVEHPLATIPTASPRDFRRRCPKVLRT